MCASDSSSVNLEPSGQPLFLGPWVLGWLLDLSLGHIIKKAWGCDPVLCPTQGMRDMKVLCYSYTAVYAWGFIIRPGIRPAGHMRSGWCICSGHLAFVLQFLHLWHGSNNSKASLQLRCAWTNGFLVQESPKALGESREAILGYMNHTLFWLLLLSWLRFHSLMAFGSSHA